MGWAFSDFNFVGLPIDGNVEEFEMVCETTEGHNPEPMTRIAALLANEEQVGVKIQTWRLHEYDSVMFIQWIRN